MPTPWVLFAVLMIGLSAFGAMHSCGLTSENVTVIHTGVSNE